MMLTLGCKHRICEACLPQLTKDECPFRCPGVRLPLCNRSVPAASRVPSGEEAMVVIARCVGSRSFFDVPDGMTVVTYNDSGDPLRSSEIVQVTRFMESFGHAPATIIRTDRKGVCERLPASKRMPNQRFCFDDPEDLQSYLGRDLGIYMIKPGNPGLHPIMPQIFGMFANSDEIAEYAFKQGFKHVVLLSCGSGDPNIRVEGSHCGYNPYCEDVFMHLDVGVSYDHLKCEPMVCARCSQAFEPTKIIFTKCSFKFHGKERPSGEKFALPPNASLEDDVTASSPITVDLNRDMPRSGVMCTWLKSERIKEQRNRSETAERTAGAVTRAGGATSPGAAAAAAAAVRDSSTTSRNRNESCRHRNDPMHQGPSAQGPLWHQDTTRASTRAGGATSPGAAAAAAAAAERDSSTTSRNRNGSRRDYNVPMHQGPSAQGPLWHQDTGSWQRTLL